VFRQRTLPLFLGWQLLANSLSIAQSVRAGLTRITSEQKAG